MMAALRKFQTTFWLLVTAGLVYWAAAGIDAGNVDLATTLPNTLKIFSMMVLHADWAFSGELAIKLLETVQMAVLGTLLASMLAVPFGFLAAANTARRASAVGKFLLNFIRVFPEIILAIIFIKAVGPGPLAGILAMGLHSVGMLGKLYSEAIEAIDKGPVEALASTGANKVQQVWFAIIPQVLPEFASYAIYRFEINARAAAILGIVGAGGIGADLIFAIQQHEWSRVGIILMGIIVLVSVIDVLSSRLRKQLV